MRLIIIFNYQNYSNIKYIKYKIFKNFITFCVGWNFYFEYMELFILFDQWKPIYVTNRNLLTNVNDYHYIFKQLMRFASP